MSMPPGQEMFDWCRELFPINRSLTGNGVRETLNFIKRIIPELTIYEVPSGTKAFDWEIPNEWNINQAWIKDSNGNILVDFQNNNLHVMGYSTPVNMVISAEQLEKHLYSLPEMPNAIPYVTSYYAPNWGFCVAENERDKFSQGFFTVFIDSTLTPGYLNYGEVLIPGETNEEILLSTYICHPSMANNELSGPVVLSKIAQHLQAQERLKYSYRIIFSVETIGAVYYLSKNLDHLKEFVKAGYVLTCIGDDRSYSYIPTRSGDSIADRVARHVVKSHGSLGKEYSWLDRGSDERQFNAPGIDLPIASLMRTKYGEYPEYHTSLDDLSLISPSGLHGGFELIWRAIMILERNQKYRINVLGEPQLGKRGLYPNTSIKTSFAEARERMNVISYLDGKKDLLEIADICGIEFENVWEYIQELQNVSLVEIR
jgi:aminopeptidase-like protein